MLGVKIKYFYYFKIQIYVAVGKVTKDTVRFAVKGHAHEPFATTAGRQGAWNDIALLKLDEDAPADFKFARLPSLILVPLSKKTPLVQAGFGKTEVERNPATDTSGILKEVSDIGVYTNVSAHLQWIQKSSELLMNAK